MRLGQVVRLWRRTSDLSLMEAAAQIGLTLPTLSRIERGEPMDGKTLGIVLRWLLEECPRKGN